jgi:hypothetical protein
MKPYLFLPLIILQIASCGSNSDKNSELTQTVKFSETDPFKNSISESEIFEIDPNKDNVIEGNQGTLIAAPKGCFLDKNGKQVTENIQIEITECLSMEEMILSNLTTTSEGKPLETDGMIYINATANGEQLTIDKNNPIYIEIPTDKVKDGMQAYKGTRDEEGNMEWSDPKDLENYLVSIDLALLDFLPPGFGEAVQSGIPFRNHKTASDELIDSLYYSLSVSDGSFLTQGFQRTDYNEAYNLNNQVVDGKYTDDSYLTNSNYYDNVDTTSADSLSEGDYAIECGVDPAKIKVLKSEEFQNTLISTREFENRLKVIFNMCRTDIIDTYLNNIEKDLWEIDQIVSEKLSDNKFYQVQFTEFSQQKKTNVQGSKKYSTALKNYYETQLKKIKSELENVKNKAVEELQSKNEVAKNVATEYKELLFKRETFRMQKYGFEWSETGWLNIDNGTMPKTWGPQRLEVIVKNGGTFDRIYSYVVYTSLKSLYRMNTNDGELFFVGNQNERQMLMPKKKMAVGISIGYNDETPYLGIQEFTTGDPKIEIYLSKSSVEDIKKAIKPYDNYSTENQVDKDLEYMTFFAKERERQKILQSEQKFIHSLWWIAFPCCEGDIELAIEEVVPLD